MWVTGSRAWSWVKEVMKSVQRPWSSSHFRLGPKLYLLIAISLDNLYNILKHALLEKLLHVYTCQINTPIGRNSKINHTCHCRNLSQHSIKILNYSWQYNYTKYNLVNSYLSILIIPVNQVYSGTNNAWHHWSCKYYQKSIIQSETMGLSHTTAQLCGSREVTLTDYRKWNLWQTRVYLCFE